MPIQLPPLSRRRFLKGVLAGAATVTLGPRFTAGAEADAVDPNRLALLSDIHVKAEKTALGREINMWDHFQRVTDEILTLSPRPLPMPCTASPISSHVIPTTAASLPNR